MASSNIIMPTYKIFQDSTEKFLDNFMEIGVSPDLTDNMKLNFEIDKRTNQQDCYLTLARPNDAVDITEIYKDCYKGTYPYKEMEDPTEVRKMISDENVYWVIFKSPKDETVGCFTYILDKEKKRGYMRGLMVKKKYQSLVDVKKLMIGSMIGMWGTFRNEIYMWYAECRTAHNKSQYLATICGIRPLGLLPNKDFFLDKIESDFFHIIYSEKVLYSLRRKNPILIPELQEIYSFIQEEYSLEDAEYMPSGFEYDPILEQSLRLKPRVSAPFEETDKFGYHKVKIKIFGTDSYIKFLYTPTVQNIEKTEYKVRNETELFVLLNELKKYAHLKRVRYIECFVSAYLPNHQRIFYNIGFKPRGYIPSWKRYNSHNGEYFEDNIIFNLEKGTISSDIKLIPESKKIISIVYS